MSITELTYMVLVSMNKSDSGDAMFTEIIKGIAGYQPLYSSDKTEAMEARGILIRRELPSAFRDISQSLEPHLGSHSTDLHVEGSDGIGRKTQAPWVRLYSDLLSPSATTGFYVVIHFSSDGKECFVTVGCGATTWNSDKGDLEKTSPDELKKRLLWATRTLEQANADTSFFNDTINLKSHYSLPKSFEQATLLCKTFIVQDMADDDFLDAVKRALSLLSVIYDEQTELRDVPQSQINTTEIEILANPNRKFKGGRQGYGLSAPERKAVEIRAMLLASDHLKEMGYDVEDTSANSSFDLLATGHDRIIKVEVKGTTSDFPDSILMTANEVALHSNHDEDTALIIVSGIRFQIRGEKAACTGGSLEWLDNWDISQWTLSPTAYQVKRPINN